MLPLVVPYLQSLFDGIHGCHDKIVSHRSSGPRHHASVPDQFRVFARKKGLDHFVTAEIERMGWNATNQHGLDASPESQDAFGLGWFLGESNCGIDKDGRFAHQVAHGLPHALRKLGRL